MVTLHDTEIDGVRCFWVDTGRPTLAAQLIFRQGMADEWLVESGWQHMLEHLALHGRGGGALSVNGSVSLLLTSFDAHGPTDQVAAHLAGLTGWLSRPEFHEFDRERGVLAAESQLRGIGAGARSLAWRYGSLGPGTAAYQEPGIGRSTPELLTARAQRAFARQNAVLVLDGPPPPALRLTLPEGARQRPPIAVPCEEQLPAAYGEEAGLILSGVVPRSAGATYLPELLQRALRDRLRDKAGAAYAPWANYEPVDDDHALILAGSDLLPELHATIADTALEITRLLRIGGPSQQEMQELMAARAQSLRDPYAAFGVAVHAAHAVLNSRAPQTFEEILNELRTLNEKSIRADLHAFHESMLLGLPSGSAWDGQLPTLAFPVARPQVTGTRARHRNWPAVPTSLVVGTAGVELVEAGQARSISFEDATGVFAYADGGRQLVSHDGWTITVDPHEWAGGDNLVAHIDRVTPPVLALPLGPRQDPPRFDRISVLRRWWAWMRRKAEGRFGAPVVQMVAFTLVVLGLLGFALASGLRLGAVAGLVFIVGVVIRAARRTRRPPSKHRG